MSQPLDPSAPLGADEDDDAFHLPFEGGFPGLDELLDAAAVRLVIDGIAHEEFVPWLAEEVMTRSPVLGALLRDSTDGDLRAAFARDLWNRFPRPDNRFRPDPRPTPSRNDPCPCGSGRKYKQCCLAADERPGLAEHLSLLVPVLDTCDDAALEALDGWSMPGDDLLDALVHWADDGRAERVVRLAAPMFSPERRPRGKLPRHAADVLEILLDDWPPGFRDEDFDALATRLGEHRDAELAGIALRALALRRHELGDVAGAWRRLRSAARRFPDDPSMAELEIDFLNAEGRAEESRALAEDWGARLVAIDPENADIAESLLDRAADVDAEIMLARAREGDAVLDRLVVLLDETPFAPTAGTHDRVRDGELVLTPTAALAEVESRWRARFGRFPSEDGFAPDERRAPGIGAPDAGADEDELTAIVSFLDDEPLALSSFSVLDALVFRTDAWLEEPWSEALHVRVLLRGEALLYRHVSREAGFETGEGLPDWGSMVWETAPRVRERHRANRSALALLGGLCAWYHDERPPGDPDDRFDDLDAALRGLDPEDERAIRGDEPPGP